MMEAPPAMAPEQQQRHSRTNTAATASASASATTSSSETSIPAAINAGPVPKSSASPSLTPTRGRRQTSITIAVPPSPIRTNLTLPTPPLPPSPHLRPRTQFDAATGGTTIILPSIPTQEPEDEFIRRAHRDSIHQETTSLRRSRERSRRRSLSEAVTQDLSDNESNSTSEQSTRAPEDAQLAATGVPTARSEADTRSSALDDDQELLWDGQDGNVDGEFENQEEEEVLEELADVTDPRPEDMNSAQNNFAGLILATQAAALLALQTLLHEMQASATHAGSALPASTSAGPSRTLQTYHELLDVLVAAVTEVSTDDAMTADERQDAFKRLNGLLDSLSAESLAAGSAGAVGQSVTLANALGDLLQSLEKVRLPPDAPSVEAARRQALPPPRPHSAAPSQLTASSSSSIGRDELRDPFAEQAQPSVFATLHRLIASLAFRCPVAQHASRATSAAASPNPSFDMGILGASGPRRASPFDYSPGNFNVGPMSSTTSLHSTSARSASSSGSIFSVPNAHISSPADAEVWSHISHILGLTRDLVASRRAQRTGAYGLYEGDASSLRPRSRRDSAASAGSDGLADPRCSLSTDPRSSLQHPPGGRSLSAGTPSANVSSCGNTLAAEHQDPHALASSTASILIRPKHSSSSLATISACGTSLSAPPSYSLHDHKRWSGATDAQVRDYQARGLLPAFGSDEKGRQRASTSSNRSYSEKGILLNGNHARSSDVGSAHGRPHSPSSRLSAGSSGATHEELHRLQRSIERVHRKAPQLTDQRAASPADAREAFPRKTVGNADLNLQELIDRLAQSNRRLDDQRVAPPPPVCRSSVAAVPPVHSDVSQRASVALERPRASSKSATSVFRKLSNVQLTSLRRFSSSSKGKEKKRLSTPTGPAPNVAMRQVDKTLLSASAADQRRADARQTSSVPTTSSRSHVSARGADSPQQRRSLEDNALFELLASSSTRRRLADQEAVMRPGSRTLPRGVQRTSMLRSAVAELPEERSRVSSPLVSSGRPSMQSSLGRQSPRNLQDGLDFQQGAEQRLAAAPAPPRHHPQAPHTVQLTPRQELSALLA
ncbi:unnamed protein product [Parajaminaea phylloscopi]